MGRDRGSGRNARRILRVAAARPHAESEKDRKRQRKRQNQTSLFHHVFFLLAAIGSSVELTEPDQSQSRRTAGISRVFGTQARSRWHHASTALHAHRRCRTGQSGSFPGTAETALPCRRQRPGSGRRPEPFRPGIGLARASSRARRDSSADSSAKPGLRVTTRS